MFYLISRLEASSVRQGGTCPVSSSLVAAFCGPSFSCVLAFVGGGGCVSLFPLRCHLSTLAQSLKILVIVTLASSGLMKVVFILGKCSIQSHFPIIKSIRMMLFDVSQDARRENIYFHGSILLPMV